MKQCSLCNEQKNLDEFYSKGKQCKKCISNKNSTPEAKAKLKAYQELYYSDPLKKKSHREKMKNYLAQDDIKKRQSDYYKKYNALEEVKEYRRLYMRKYLKDLYENDPAYKLYSKALNQLRKEILLIKAGKVDNPYTYLFKKHFDKKFNKKNKFTWENYGDKWELDHIFSAIKMLRLGYEIKDVNRLENLQPLSIRANRSKKEK